MHEPLRKVERARRSLRLAPRQHRARRRLRADWIVVALPVSTSPSPIASDAARAEAGGRLTVRFEGLEETGGDFSRHTPPVRDGISGFFASFDRNKRSIQIDLKTESGRDLARRLCREADVVVENFRPGVADGVGIGWDDLSRENEN